MQIIHWPEYKFQENTTSLFHRFWFFLFLPFVIAGVFGSYLFSFESTAEISNLWYKIFACLAVCLTSIGLGGYYANKANTIKKREYKDYLTESNFSKSDLLGAKESTNSSRLELEAIDEFISEIGL